MPNQFTVFSIAADERERMTDRLIRYTRKAKSGCVEWQRSIGGHGYGQLRCHSLSTMVLVHRLSLELFIGQPIPDGMLACHRCDNKLCVNPVHLFVGSWRDNAHDMIAKGRNSEPPHFLGEAHHNSVLTVAKVGEIRRLWAFGGMTQKSIARMFGVSDGAVKGVLQGRTWVHVA